MLQKALRLRQSRHITRTIRQGKRHKLSFFAVLVRKTEYPSRATVIVSKKVTKSAVQRNRIKRRMRHAIAPIISQRFGYDMVVFPECTVASCSYDDIVKDITQLQLLIDS